jgi:Xaa-Pro aminopeptidase
VTTVDFRARLQRAKSAVADAGLTALLISPGPDLRYLTGYDSRLPDRLTCLIIPAVGDPLVVVPRLEEAAAAASPLAAAQVQLLTWDESDDPYALVGSQLPRNGAVAVSDRMWVVQAFSLREAMPGLDQRASGEILKTLRMRKDENEVAALREAGAAIDSVHARMPEWLRAGRTESAVGADVRVAMLEAGHTSADLVIVASGPNAASPHHELSERMIQSGDAVVVDIGGTMPSGYWSDCTRTYVVGEPSKEVVALYSVLQVAQEAACKVVRAGVAAQTIDAAAREVIAEAGYGSYFTHRTGHGIGLQAHEEPYISGDNTEPLAAGMVFSIEPGIYIPARHGARLEDIVVCTHGGRERLNSRPHDLVVVKD